MRVLYGTDPAEGGLPWPVATVGNFDGVHRGHRRILQTLRQQAGRRGGTAVVITFAPHPQKVLHPDSAPRLICTPAQKQRLLAEAGADVMLELPFTRELAALDPETFARRVLSAHLGVREVHIGRNFRFGCNRQGDFTTLEALGRRLGFMAAPVEGVRHAGQRISSSRVRQTLARGDVELAAVLLGREAELVGKVVRGQGRGRTLGFPTANLEVENELTPFTGVYATRLVVEGRTFPAVTNIGSRPTFPGAGSAVETHALEAPGDLYGREVALRFVRRLRDERRFASVDDLAAQIRKDIAAAGTALTP